MIYVGTHGSCVRKYHKEFHRTHEPCVPTLLNYALCYYVLLIPCFVLHNVN